MCLCLLSLGFLCKGSVFFLNGPTALGAACATFLMGTLCIGAATLSL